MRIRFRGQWYESPEHMLADLAERERRRAPFKAQADALFDEFIEYLEDQGLSDRTIRKHGSNIHMFITYLVDYTDEEDFATIRKGNAYTNFQKWYKRKVMGAFDPFSLKSSVTKFFKWLAAEKGIYNEKVLGKRKKK